MLRCATSHQKPEIKVLDETLICATRAASGKLALRQPAETQRSRRIRFAALLPTITAAISATPTAKTVVGLPQPSHHRRILVTAKGLHGQAQRAARQGAAPNVRQWPFGKKALPLHMVTSVDVYNPRRQSPLFANL
jgi:hypothetical protein